MQKRWCLNNEGNCVRQSTSLSFRWIVHILSDLDNNRSKIRCTIFSQIQGPLELTVVIMGPAPVFIASPLRRTLRQQDIAGHSLIQTLLHFSNIFPMVAGNIAIKSFKLTIVL